MIRFACPGCNATFTVGDEKAGKTGKCPKCQSQFVIPDAPEASNPAQDAPPPLPPTPSAYIPPPPPPPVVSNDPNEPVEILPCPKCKANLSVLPGDLGLDIECPTCQTVYKANRADAPPPPDTGRSGSKSSGLVKIGSGAKDDDDDDDRPSKRRKSSRRDDDDDDDDDRPKKRRSSSRRDDDDDDDDDRPRRRKRSRGSSRNYEPHRGVVCLVLAILGWFVCPICAIVSWVMSAQDMKEMDAGRMDPEGRGMTQAAKIISMIVCLLYVLAILFYCVFVVFIVGIGAAAR